MIPWALATSSITARTNQNARRQERASSKSLSLTTKVTRAYDTPMLNLIRTTDRSSPMRDATQLYPNINTLMPGN